MSDRGDGPPAFEVKVAARAAEITFHAVDDVEWRTEGTARVHRTRRRDGLPSPVRPGVRYTDIRISSHLQAWLQESPPGDTGTD
jgi:hypothetical protein